MVDMPDDLEPEQADIWRELCPDGSRFDAQDAPILRLLCFWHSVAREAQRQMARNGRMAIFDPIAYKPIRDANGKTPLMVRKSPALAVLADATKEIRALSDALGITPSARSRMGMEAKAPAATEHGKLLVVMQRDRADKERKAVGA